jgi:ribonuclease Z
MTAADAGLDRVDVVGPPDTSHYLATLRTSVMRQVLHLSYSPGEARELIFRRDRFVVEPHCTSVYAAPGTAEVVYQTPNLTVKAVTLIPSSVYPDPRPENPAEDWDPTLPSFRLPQLSRPNLERWRQMIVDDLFGRDVRPRPIYKPEPQAPAPSGKQATNPFVHPPNGFINAMRADQRYLLPLPSEVEQATDLVYICQAPDVRGKFDVARANALRVPNGPARGRLVRGESLEVDDPSAPGGKRTVRPEDCLVGGGPGAVSCSPTIPGGPTDV